ncbi:MAG: AI-2E family transporter [Vulcanimicrobiaceae bacterium]
MDARLTFTIKVLAVIILSAIVLTGFIDFLGHIRTVATIVIGAIFLCYAIYPAVRQLNTKLPLWASILIAYVVLISLVAAALSYVVPALGGNVKQFVHDAPAYVRNAQAALSDPHNPFVARLPVEVRDYLAKIPSEVVTFLNRYGGEAASSFLNVLVSAVSVLALFVAVPVVAIYLMIDANAMYRAFVSIIPLSIRPKALKILSEIDSVVGGFIRGQLLVAAIIGVLFIVMLSALHVRYAILIGVLAAVLEIIPYVGAVTGGAIAVLVALATNGPLNALFVTIGFIVINQLEGHLIAPFVVSGSVGLSPLAVILALLAGGELYGLPGLLVAVPVAGIIKVLFVNLVPRVAPPEPGAAPLPRPTERARTRQQRKQAR